MKKILSLCTVLVLAFIFTSFNSASASSENDVANNDVINTFVYGKNRSVVEPLDLSFTSGRYFLSSSINTKNVSLYDKNDKKVSAKVVLSSDNKTITILPTKPLSYSSKYTIKLMNIQYLEGDYLVNTAATFTTEAKPKNAKLDVTKVKKPTLSSTVLKQLIQTATNNNKNMGVYKWNKDLTVAILGSPTKTDKSEVTKVLKEISALTGLKATVTTNKSKANVKMYFGTSTWGVKYVPTMPSYATGYFYAKTTEKFGIDRSDIFVSTQITTSQKNHTIRQMLTMSLGFPYNVVDNKKSIFYRNSNATSYTSTDKAVIKALYSPYIANGMTTAHLNLMFGK